MSHIVFMVQTCCLGPSTSTPYIYGYGLDARISTRTVTSTTVLQQYPYSRGQ